MKKKNAKKRRNLYPAMDEIMKADRKQLALWLRQLPTPCCLREVRLLELINRQFQIVGGWNDSLWNETQQIINGVN